MSLFSKPAPKKFQLGLDLDERRQIRIVTVVSTEEYGASLKEGMKLNPDILLIHNPQTPVRLSCLDRMASVNGFTIIYKDPAKLDLGGLSKALLAIEPWRSFRDSTLTSPPYSSSRCTLAQLVALVKQNLLPKIQDDAPQETATAVAGGAK
ncbi:MAG: hypothetical protein PHC70_02170 [Patescibacteria group bacterium]|nr:hypothetical protein [Patescibacteria group bacterium]